MWRDVWLLLGRNIIGGLKRRRNVCLCASASESHRREHQKVLCAGVGIKPIARLISAHQVVAVAGAVMMAASLALFRAGGIRARGYLLSGADGAHHHQSRANKAGIFVWRERRRPSLRRAVYIDEIMTYVFLAT